MPANVPAAARFRAGPAKVHRVKHTKRTTRGA